MNELEAAAQISLCFPTEQLDRVAALQAAAQSTHLGNIPGHNFAANRDFQFALIARAAQLAPVALTGLQSWPNNPLG